MRTLKFSGTLQYSPLKYVTFCYLLEINVHDGHNTAPLQRDIVKCYGLVNSVLNNLITTDYMIVGHDLLIKQV